MIITENDEQLSMSTKDNIKKNHKKMAEFITIISILMACFCPTSISGIIFDTEKIIWYYLLSSFIIGAFFLINKWDMKLICILILLMVYLEITTLYCTTITGATFSIARFAPIFLCAIFFTVKCVGDISFKVLNLVLEFVTVIITIWNFSIIMKIESVMNYTVRNYSQFNYFTVDNMINLGKPIFTFGSHTFAAYYYMFIFYMWYVTLKNDKKSCLRYYIYLICLLYFTVMLKSSTSLMFSVVMFLLIIRLSKNTVFKIVITLCVIMGIVLLFNTELYTIYYKMVTSSDNGIIPRYLSANNIFIDNFNIIKDTILGIGFTIPRNYAITYTDSGYIVYFTMGNIILPIGLFYMLFKFLDNNIRKYAKEIFIFILMFEFAIPSIIYLKTIFFLIFTVNYLKSVEKKINYESVI